MVPEGNGARGKWCQREMVPEREMVPGLQLCKLLQGDWTLGLSKKSRPFGRYCPGDQKLAVRLLYCRV